MPNAGVSSVELPEAEVSIPVWVVVWGEVLVLLLAVVAVRVFLGGGGTVR